MPRPFRRRRDRRKTARQGYQAVELPTSFLDLSRREQLEWCGALLEGLVPLQRDVPDEPERIGDGLRRWWNERRAVRQRTREANGPSRWGRLRARFERHQRGSEDPPTEPGEA